MSVTAPHFIHNSQLRPAT